MKKIVLFGSGGYVGNAFLDLLLKKPNVEVFSFSSREELNFTDKDIVSYLLDTVQPDFVINCAGYTGKPNVDSCETDRNNCLKGNVIFPIDLADLCADKNIMLGHVSSGCIYTGKRNDGTGFTEADLPNFSFRNNNCSFYSGTKALCEELMSQYNNVYIWRLRIPFNNINSSRNYLTKLMTYKTLLEAENSISHLNEFVDASLQCYTKELNPGIYNITNTGSVSTSGIVELLRKYSLPYKDYSYKFFTDEEEFMATAAKTPRSNCVLDNSKLLKSGIYVSDAYEAVEKSLQTWR